MVVAQIGGYLHTATLRNKWDAQKVNLTERKESASFLSTHIHTVAADSDLHECLLLFLLLFRLSQNPNHHFCFFVIRFLRFKIVFFGFGVCMCCVSLPSCTSVIHRIFMLTIFVENFICLRPTLSSSAVRAARLHGFGMLC